jgi:hypothetical protein
MKAALKGPFGRGSGKSYSLSSAIHVAVRNLPMSVGLFT